MESAKRVVPLVLEYLNPKSVVEIGCGEGEWLREFQDTGARILGLDDEKYGQTEFWMGNKASFQPVNMDRVRLTCSNKFDLAICLEVAHRYAEDRAKEFVHDLCLLSDVVLFSAAIPGQEEDVVNGQMPSYWAELFRQNGFMMLDCIRPQIWEDEGIGIKYRQNLIVYVREKELVKYPNLFRLYISDTKKRVVDIVHPKQMDEKVKVLNETDWNLKVKRDDLEVSRLMDRAKSASGKRYKVALLCNQKIWKDIFDFIDTSEVDICAYFGTWEHVPEELYDVVKDKFHPIDDCFNLISSFNVDYYITAIPYGAMMRTYYPGFSKIGIDRDRILNISMYFGGERYVGLMYYYQWKFLLKEKPELDYFITGSSATKMGFDLNVMKPFNGIKLLTNAQDLYYQYKIAEAYLVKCIPNENKIKFALIEMTPKTFTNMLCNNSVYFNELFYFPIISHANTEYHHTKRGALVEKVITEKAVKWLDLQIKDIKKFSWNDRDGQCGAMNLQSIKKWSEAAKNNQVRNVCSKIETSGAVVEFNIYVLEKYIELCERYSVAPIVLFFPYANRIRDSYPQESKNFFFEVMKRFGNRIHVIDLWKLDIPEEYTSDLVHLNFKGAKIVTEAVKAYVEKLKHRLNGFSLMEERFKG